MGYTVPPPPIWVTSERIECAFCGTPRIDVWAPCGQCGAWELRHVEEVTAEVVPEYVEVTSIYDTVRQYLRIR